MLRKYQEVGIISFCILVPEDFETWLLHFCDFAQNSAQIFFCDFGMSFLLLLLMINNALPEFVGSSETNFRFLWEVR